MEMAMSCINGTSSEAGPWTRRNGSVKDKTKTPRNLPVVVVLVWAPCVLAQDYPHSPVIADIVIEDTREISFGDGDNFPMTWADDGKLYTMYCDGVGFGDNSLSQWISNGFAEVH